MPGEQEDLLVRRTHKLLWEVLMAVLTATPEIAAAMGSACHEGSTEPSPVLLAQGIR